MSKRSRTAKLELAPRPPPAFEFLESKVKVPALRPGAVPRTGLVNRLRAATSFPVATVIAPAGYGKTIALSQWAQRDPREVAWITIDDRDNDPVVLLRHMAAALDRHDPVEHGVVAALRSPGQSVWTAAVPRLAAAFSARSPVVLVLDDIGLLHSRGSLEILSALIDDEAEGSMVVLAGRGLPRLPLASLRATERLLELGPRDLAMTKRDAQLLLRATGVRLSEAQTAELVEQCEGWAAALYLAALSIRDGKTSELELAPFSGDDRYLADYFRSEYLSHLRPGPLRFLRRTSILDRMSGELCDAVLDDQGSAQELEKIERANLFLVPLDNHREWYRYHYLFRGLLRRELTETEPELVPVLHSRAADWYRANGDDESALEHAYEAGDDDRSAALLTELARPLYYAGRVRTLERWLRRFERGGLLSQYPALALIGARVHLMRGRAETAERWLDAAEGGALEGELPDGSASLAPWISTVRALLCQAGPKKMLQDAEAALEELPESSDWRPDALVAQGEAMRLLNQDARADEVLASAAELAAALGSTDVQVVALSERALLLADREEHEGAEELSREAHTMTRSGTLEWHPASAIELAARARVLVRSGSWNEARAALSAARELLPQLTTALPWLSMRTRLELIRGSLALRNVQDASELLDEMEDILRERPKLGVLATAAKDLEQELDDSPKPEEARPAGLTPAELRLLPLLASHLSFREIAEQLYVSRNTIKTQAISVYRKLGASSRSEAIAKAHELGLGDQLRVLVSNNR